MRGTFLESENKLSCDLANFIFVGINYCSAGYLKGVELAPSKIRELSYRYANADGSSHPLKVYSPEEGYILKDLVIKDYGDIKAESLEKLYENLASIDFPISSIPIFVGGDHSVTYELVRRVCEMKKERKTVVVQFDAHSDFIDEFEEYPHGSVMNAISKLEGVERIIHFGIRGNLNSEPAISSSKKVGNMVVPYNEVDERLSEVLNYIQDKNVYITFDTDFLNPACAPATNCPEPGGPSYEEALKYLKSIIQNAGHIMAMDIVEYNPTCEGAILTGTTLVNLIMEVISYMKSKETTCDYRMEE